MNHKWNMAAAFLIVLYVSPYFILGEGAHVRTHDNLDSNVVWYKILAESGQIFAPNGTEIPNMLGGVPREAFGSELNQVWTNIIDNAVGAMAGQGELVLRTYRQDGWVVVEIRDTGPGIPESIQSKIFDPFFTTKPPGKGTGLGLNISHNIIVHKHKGKLAVYSRPGATCFEIKLPLNFAAQSVGA